MKWIWLGLATLAGFVLVAYPVAGTVGLWIAGDRYIILSDRLVRQVPICAGFPGGYIPFYEYELIRIGLLFNSAVIIFVVSVGFHLSHRGAFGTCSYCRYPVMFVGRRCMNCFAKTG